jgi:hypothetical protein
MKEGLCFVLFIIGTSSANAENNDDNDYIN